MHSVPVMWAEAPPGLPTHTHCGDSRQGGREGAPVMSPSSAKRAGSTWFVHARCLLGEGACGRSPVLPVHFLPVSTRDCRHSSI